MKKYLIFAGSIINMGGAQMYISNKEKYMKTLGWDVQVFSGLKGSILLHNLEEYGDLIIPEMEYIPNFYSMKVRETIILKILDSIGHVNGDEVVIESSTGHMAAWAEIIAERLKARHFTFLLDEHFDFDKGFIDFFRFKHNRNELALITRKSLGILFGGEYAGKEDESTMLSASCNNVTEDITDERFDEIPYGNFDLLICSLGRLNKKYIPTVIEGFKAFALQHQEKRIAYVFIGDQPEGFIPDMRIEIKKALDLSNVTVYQMGYVYPIPSSFFDHVDAGVGSAGSSRVMWNKRIPTISMDSKDGLPIGILGYTTNNTLYHENEKRESLPKFLDMILFSNYLENKQFTPYDIMPYDENFKKHMAFIDRMSDQRRYYDILSIRLQEKDSIIKKMLISSIGLKNYKLLKDTIKH